MKAFNDKNYLIRDHKVTLGKLYYDKNEKPSNYSFVKYRRKQKKIALDLKRKVKAGIKVRSRGNCKILDNI